MNSLKTSKSPLFFTMRKLIFMLDELLLNPFFKRDSKGKILNLPLD